MTAPPIKAIPTKHHGVLFRSRTEARWAVFFDALGVAWEYEREGYVLPSGRYLPDFWLPKHELWAEIKGQPPTNIEQQRCRELAQGTSRDVAIFVGAPDLPDPLRRTITGWLFTGHGWSHRYWWIQCTACPLVYFDDDWLVSSCHGAASPYGHDLSEAYEQARSARFGT